MTKKSFYSELKMKAWKIYSVIRNLDYASNSDVI